MHLKTLTMKGFKSFASSTTLRLEPGITAVVGPNGSGKSNVVDALTWVMGEQGAKNLRGGSMADVIFAGAGGRAPLGRAEVSLTIDNTDGALPIDYSEVTITRTLFRGGGSEYQINATPCRLLDVQELLSDTGLGRQMHVIVGQGQLDAVLTATPEERRGFIEEAAGVLKHRRRKERALRKLDSMAADLARLTDLTAELRRQLGPLARQASVARRARTIQVEVRDATARLLADDVVQAQSLLEVGDEDKALLARRRAAVEEAERVARARQGELAAIEATSAQRLARSTATWQELTQAAQSLESLADVAAERVRGLASTPPPALGTDPDELERRAAEAEAQEAAAADAIEAARTSLAELARAREDAEAAETGAERALAELQRRQAERRESLARAGGRVASARSRHEAARTALDRAREALAAARARAQAARSALEEAGGSTAAGGAEAGADGGPGAGAGAGSGQPLAEAADSGQTLAAAAHEEASGALSQARDAVGAANDARRQAAADLATWTSRRDTLAMSLASQDATVDLADAGLAGVVGSVAESMTIERGWENAVAAVLGELSTAALVADDTAALAALEHVRRTGAGALRLVVGAAGDDGGAAWPDAVGPDGNAVDATAVVDAGPSEPESSPRAAPAQAEPEPQLAGQGGQDGPAGPVVRTARAGQTGQTGQAVPATSVVRATAPEMAPALDTLLRGAWLVEDAESAARLRREEPTAVVATRLGEVLGPARATSPGPGTSSVLEVAAAHDEAVARAEAAVQAEADAEAALQAARAREEEARAAVSSALANLRAADAEAARIAERHARLGSAARAADEEEGRARRVVERAQEELTGRTAELADAEAALARLDAGRDAPGTRPGTPTGTPPGASAAAPTGTPAGAADPTPADLDAAVERARQERADAAQTARLARAAETEARLALRTAEERERSGRGRSGSLRMAARREREQRAAARRAQERRASQAAAASRVRDEARLAAEAARGWVEQAQEERRRVEAQRSEALAASQEVAGRLDAVRDELAALTDAAHREEIARAEQRMRLQALADRAMSELGLTLDLLVEEFGPHMLVPDVAQDADVVRARHGAGETDEAGEAAEAGAQSDAGETRGGRPYVRTEQQKRLARASKDLARLGKVNPLALEEHAALEQRHQFLSEQLADLTASRQDLLGLVAQIDDRVQEAFARAYEDTAREFTTVFDRLFPGGEGRLVLTDPDDMLTTGIDIEARPAGKRVKRLSLLSGGERSLAAVALLVAIFKARPSPFYVMDEVEAALDDTNLGRLLEIFTELRESSQLIIITHQTRTMEVADALYGISMREGVTTVVSQRLDRTRAPGHRAAAAV